MTPFIKFIMSSLTLTLRAMRINSNRKLLQKNVAKCFCSTNVDISQPKCLPTKSIIRGHSRYSNDSYKSYVTPLLLGVSFPFFGFLKKKEEESELITTIKKSILLIQKQEYKKAEQMLHLALRIAQTEQNEDGITYIYDVMANLAFEIGQYDKAQKLFKVVMQRILSNGAPQDDLRIVSMSLKLAKILEHKGDYFNAENGYQYCLKILQELIDKGSEEKSVIALWEINIDWYAHMLLAVSRYTEAMKYMEKAYVACVKHNGELHEQTIVLLNDLGSISFMKGNLDDALHYLNKAAEIGEKLPDMPDISSIHVNLGNVYMKKGLLNEAKQACLKGWKLSKKINNNELIDEANLCLSEVNKLLMK